MEANAYGKDYEEVSWFDSRISAPPLQRLPDGDHNGPPTDVCYQIRLIYFPLTPKNKIRVWYDDKTNENHELYKTK